jgi:hypothetical protein
VVLGVTGGGTVDGVVGPADRQAPAKATSTRTTGNAAR